MTAPPAARPRRYNIGRCEWVVALSGMLLAFPPDAAAGSINPVAGLAAPAPDYGDPAAWAAGPGGPGPSVVVPAGASSAAAAPAVDVFYVHPTTQRSDSLYNQDVRDPEANRWVDESVVARQASAFNACCRIYAPRYRAATYKVVSSPYRNDAFALAYGDIERAFDWYMSHENKGRPFILAGHSQGAFHLATLIERRIDGAPAQRQLVAVYLIGINLAEGDFGRRFRHVGACDLPDETGCVVQWNAWLPHDDIDRTASRSEKTYVDRHGDEPGKTTLCVNPLTFDRSREAAPRAKALGAIPGSPGFGAPRPLQAGAVAARCERGLLIVEPDPSLELPPLPGGSMHYHDFGLFYGDIRANALSRGRAHLQLGQAARRPDSPPAFREKE